MILVRKYCYRPQSAISLMIGLVWLYVVSVRFCSGQATSSSTVPEIGSTHIRTSQTLHTKQDVAENRLWHLLAWQNHLDQVADEHEKRGKDGRWLRDYVQNRLGLEEGLFAPVHESAQRLAETLQTIDQEARAILDEKRMASLQSRTSTSTDSGNSTQLHQLTLDRQQAIHDEIVRLRDEMEPDAFERLNGKLDKQTVQQPQIYFRRTGEAAKSSGQQSVSPNSLLRGVMPVQGATPGAGDERDLMAESCLDDEFNPGDCDLDVGTAVAAVPDSEEIDTFAFSDMSPDYMGFYDVWPGVETDLFQGGVDLDANRADGPGGSAMRNLSDPITIGTIYTDVATPFACHYHENRGEQCDPIWNGQVGAVESTAAPSISSLSPPSAVPSSSGTLAINGDNLLNIFDPAGQPDVTISSSSVTLSSPTAPSPASTSVRVNYSIAADATPGSYDVTASNNWGTSNAAAFTIDSGATVQSQNRAISQSAITVSPLVTGAGCSGEIVNPTRIVWWGSVIGPYPAGDIECMTTNVMAGQQIYIGVPPVPLLNNNWLNVRNLTWTISDCSDSNCTTKTSTVHAVKNYSVTYDSNNVPTKSTLEAIGLVNMNQNPIQFYFTVPGKAEQVDVTGTFTDGSTLSAWARFYVEGPTLNLQANMPTDGSGVQIYNYNNQEFLGIWGVNGKPDPITGQATTTGIYFQGNAKGFPDGTDGLISWVQTISSQQSEYLGSSGGVPAPVKTGLDTDFPYDLDANTADRPADQLTSSKGEDWRTFTATMYAMWDPGLPSGCQPAYSTLTQNPDGSYTGVSTPSTCTQSIPIPLSSVTYHWSGCAINTLANHVEPDESTSTWAPSTLNGCPKQTLGTPGLTSQFPTWTTLGNY